ncbi:uncharacterized protein LOC128626774 [Artibeus jamaicensis]|uniref:uncharacterized protein LOC128626774 n=1 Tax=Artibeus jamaicensis TaxID=9417 RepID=UPI00235AB244|nr:uncharacterized protein LOC128626774 [Artibeus jamaicensis]
MWRSCGQQPIKARNKCDKCTKSWRGWTWVRQAPGFCPLHPSIRQRQIWSCVLAPFLPPDKKGDGSRHPGPLAPCSLQERRSVTLLNGKATIKVPEVATLGEGVQRPGAPPSPLPAHRVGRPEWGRRLALPVSPSRHTVGTLLHQLRLSHCPRLEVLPLLGRAQRAPVEEEVRYQGWGVSWAWRRAESQTTGVARGGGCRDLEVTVGCPCGSSEAVRPAGESGDQRLALSQP